MRTYLDDEDLVIEPHGLEQLWSLSRGLRVPRSTVTRADWQEHAVIAGRDIGMRFGTGFPGVLAAGWFYSKSFGKSYLFLRRPTYRWKKMQIEADHVVTLRLRNFTCDTIRLTIADKSLANTILHWAKN